MPGGGGGRGSSSGRSSSRSSSRSRRSRDISGGNYFYRVTGAQQSFSPILQRPPAQEDDKMAGMGETAMIGMTFGIGSEIGSHAIRGLIGSGSSGCDSKAPGEKMSKIKSKWHITTGKHSMLITNNIKYNS